MNIRKALPKEEKLLAHLISKASVTISDDWEEKLLVSPMNDGGMGSLTLYPEGIIPEERQFGGKISEYLFFDDDGTTVIASLNVDKKGKLFELDIWKTDYSSLISLPSSYK
ncbi:hypothetical protein VB264_22045 [Arcicella aquatica]|uniref:DUF6984 domain-containing protein n=1 Tax=Arcicella aquatica TaxID=217141 RepID=A0ABU5QUG0_9BACT|nr:hypothetical protein [Arcicella aquatica]MEA5260495.1 hypothetical protein [Arcicella aquatica]